MRGFPRERVKRKRAPVIKSMDQFPLEVQTLATWLGDVRDIEHIPEDGVDIYRITRSGRKTKPLHVVPHLRNKPSQILLTDIPKILAYRVGTSVSVLRSKKLIKGQIRE